MRNISEQTKNEKALRNSEEKFRALVETTDEWIWEMNLNCIHTFSNPAVRKLLGYDPEELYTRNCLDLMHKDDHEMVRKVLGASIQEKSGWNGLVVRWLHKNGDVRYLESNAVPVLDLTGHLTGFYGADRDITERRETEKAIRKSEENYRGLVEAELTNTVRRLENEIEQRKQTENALRESDERFRSIFEQNEDALFLIRPDTCHIIDLNPAASALFGYTKDEFIDKGLVLILESGDFEICANTICSACPVSGLRLDRLTCRKKNGSTITVSLRGKMVLLKQDSVLFCSFRDITERLRMEEESKMLQLKLIHANKMSSLGTLVSGIAHEINNPNHFIMVNAQMVSDVWKDAMQILTDYYREHGDFPLGGVPYSEMRYIMPQLLTAMSDGSGRIKNIIDKLKDFARQGREAIDQPVDINKVIASAAVILSSQIEKYTDRFQFVAGINLPPAKGNCLQLEQVITNLIMNALVSLRDRGDAVIISTFFDEAAGSIQILVRDEGIGMSREVLDHITEPFYTTRIEEGGTGLGLSISYSIIQNHQGSLTFSSERGKGTTAIISLPRFHNSTERNNHAAEHLS